MRKGFIAISVTIVAWSIGIVLIKLLSNYFSVNVQNFFRYSSATLILVVISRLNLRISFSKQCILEVLIAAVLVFLFQVLAVTGLYMTTSTIASILLKLNVVFTSILAYIFFEEERKIISSKAFILGIILASIGVIGFSIKDIHSSIVLDIGAVLTAFSSLVWSLYTIVVKRLVVRNDPLVMTTIVYSIASILFLPLAFTEDLVSQIIGAPFEIIIILTISGILSVGIGNWMNFIAIKDVGVSLPAVLQLLVPVLVGVFSYLILCEEISLRTVVFGFMVILGCLLTIKEYMKAME